MLDDIEDVDVRLALIDAAQRLYDYQSQSDVAEAVEAVRVTAYDAAIGMRDGQARVDCDIIGVMGALMGQGAVLTWCLACSSIVGPLRPEILASLAQCTSQFAWPVQMPEFREARFSISERRAWRTEVTHALTHAVAWHRTWSEDGPVAAIAELIRNHAHDGETTSECDKALGLGLHFLASWRLRVTEL